MKIVFYVLTAIVGAFAFLSLIRGVETYLATSQFDLTQFAIAIIGLLLAGLWLKRARSM